MNLFTGLPKNWDVSRIDRVATVNARIGWKALTASEYQDDGYAFLATPNIKNAEIDFDNVNYISEFRYQESPELQLTRGDVLLTKDGFTLGTVNVVKHLPRPATVNGSIAVLRPFAIHPGFLRYVIACSVTQAHIQAVKDGMDVLHLFQRDIKKLPIPLPPVDEQHRIAAYLNVETARIDALIAKRERQRGLLEKQYLSTVHAAIIGLDEPGERRASSVSWLGGVPAAWPVMPVGYQFEVLLGKMLNQDRVQGNHLRPYLRNTNVQWDRIDTNDLQKMDFPPGEKSRYRLLPGDLLVCEGGEPGRSAIWDGNLEELYYQKALHRVRPRGYSSPRWLYYCMRAATAQNVFAIEGNVTTIAHLTGEQLKAHRFPFPARKEQDRITAQLDVASRRRKLLDSQLLKQKSVLAERRQAVITAAVTGKIDVSTASGRGIED